MLGKHNNHQLHQFVTIKTDESSPDSLPVGSTIETDEISLLRK